MTQQLTTRNRKELHNKMSIVFREDTKGLDVEMQETLIDDMVTAFENRLTVFKRTKKDLK